MDLRHRSAGEILLFGAGRYIREDASSSSPVEVIADEKIPYQSVSHSKGILQLQLWEITVALVTQDTLRGRSRAGRTRWPPVTDRSDPNERARHRCAIALRSKDRPRLPT